MQTFSYGDGLVEDGKYTYFRVSAASYPITIEQTYTIKFNGLLEYPDQNVQNPDESVEHLLYTVETPDELGLRYKMINCSLLPKKEHGNKNTVYTFETANLVAIKKDRSSGPSARYFPRILVSPNKFKFGGYEGDMSSWKNFGSWSYDLIGNGNRLSGKSKVVIGDLVKNVSSDEDKARLIYSYLQQNMRYVSIQLGIGDGSHLKPTLYRKKNTAIVKH